MASLEDDLTQPTDCLPEPGMDLEEKPVLEKPVVSPDVESLVRAELSRVQNNKDFKTGTVHRFLIQKGGGSTEPPIIIRLVRGADGSVQIEPETNLKVVESVAVGDSSQNVIRFKKTVTPPNTPPTAPAPAVSTNNSQPLYNVTPQRVIHVAGGKERKISLPISKSIFYKRPKIGKDKEEKEFDDDLNEEDGNDISKASTKKKKPEPKPRPVSTYTGEYPYPCDKCEKKFRFDHHLKRHTLTHTGERPHVCNECGKTFTRAEHLRRHLITHTGERPYECRFCNKKFLRLYVLRGHIQKAHGISREKQIEDDKEFKESEKLLNLEAKKEEKKIKRKQREEKRKSEMEQKEKEREEAGKPPRKKRSKRAKTVEDIDDNDPIAIANRSLECSVCNKKFSRSGNLLRHLKVHAKGIIDDDEENNEEGNMSFDGRIEIDLPTTDNGTEPEIIHFEPLKSGDEDENDDDKDEVIEFEPSEDDSKNEKENSENSKNVDENS